MWVYKDQPFSDEQIGSSLGFVYKITNLLDGRVYFGQKKFWFTKTRTVKGKKKREKAPSDWKQYWSSSNELKADVVNLGEENFIREILHLCSSKGEMNYLEMREQVIHDTLLYPRLYYNEYVGGRINRSHLKQLIKTKDDSV